MERKQGKCPVETRIFPVPFHKYFLSIKDLAAVTLQPGRWEPFHRYQGPHGYPLSFVIRVTDGTWDSHQSVFPEYLAYITDGLWRVCSRMVMVEFKWHPGTPYDFPAHGTVLPSAVRHDEGLPIETQ